MRDLPSGTVTFLFSDIEGSTRALAELGPAGYADALARHREEARAAFALHGGVEVDTQGDSFFVAFPTAAGALEAATRVVRTCDNRLGGVRVAVHSGTPLVTDEGYVGMDVNRAARIAAAGHAGQVLVSSSTAALVGREGLVDLGEHRFKDLQAPERVFQLANRSFPPLRSLRRTNLPVPAAPFLGREQELADVASLLRRQDLRVLTLTGTAGTGKTRLALQAAADASDDYPGGVWWIPLTPLRDALLLRSAIGDALGLDDDADVVRRLAEARALLLLDNAEHLLPALAAEVAQLSGSSPTTVLLVTSRERLQLSAERSWPVPPLTPPDAERFFIERARAVGVDVGSDERVRELSSRLDHLPLALELAAARTVLFSPAQLLERLSQRLDLLRGGRDSDPRQQTLRATLEWSYDLLTTHEQRLFRALSVFASGCTYDAAETVADADADTLQSLLDKSLLRRREADGFVRYWLLETVRAYAAERLEASGEAAAVRLRHAEYIAGVLQRAWSDPGDRPARVRELVLRERHELSAAMANSRASDALELQLRLLWDCRMYIGHPAIAREYSNSLDAVLVQRARLETLERARAASLGARRAFFVRRDLGHAEDLARESLALYEELGDEEGIGVQHNLLGRIRLEQGDLDEAEQLARRALEFAETSESPVLPIAARGVLALIALERGDTDGAESLLESNALTAERLWGSDPDRYAASSGLLALARGDPHAAHDLFANALDRYHQEGDEGAIWEVVLPTALVVVDSDPKRAAMLLGWFEAQRSPTHWAPGRIERRLHAELSNRLGERLDTPERRELETRGARLSHDEVVELASRPLRGEAAR